PVLEETPSRTDRRHPSRPKKREFVPRPPGPSPGHSPLPGYPRGGPPAGPGSQAFPASPAPTLTPRLSRQLDRPLPLRPRAGAKLRRPCRELVGNGLSLRPHLLQRLTDGLRARTGGKPRDAQVLGQVPHLGVVGQDRKSGV